MSASPAPSGAAWRRGLWSGLAMVGLVALGVAATRLPAQTLADLQTPTGLLGLLTVGLALLLLLSRLRAHRSEARARLFRELVDNLQIGLCVVRWDPRSKPPRLRLIARNPRAAEFARQVLPTGLTEDASLLQAAFSQRDMIALCRDVVTSRRPKDVGDLTYELFPGRSLTFAVQAFPLGGDKVGVAFADVTDARQAERALKLRESQLRHSQQLAHLGSWEWDLAHDHLTWSDEMYRVFGYEPMAMRVTYATMLAHIHPDDRSAVAQDLRALQDSRRSLNHQYRIVRRDGAVRVVAASASPTLGEADEVQRLSGVAQDVTEQWQARQDLMEAHQRLADSGDAERLSLAQELHDRPLQALYGIRLGLAVLAESLPAGPVREAGDRQQQALNDVVAELRDICQDLRPPALMSFGLEVAIRAYADRFAAANPELTLDLDLDADGKVLAERTRVGLYRILQHALGNVARHAGASQVSVRLAMSPNQVRLQVRDDGVGFEVPTSWLELGRQGHMGLMGASERAASVGGTFTVESAPGEGTLVRVVAPLAPPTERDLAALYGNVTRRVPCR